MLMTADSRQAEVRAENPQFVRRTVILSSVVALVCLALCWSAFRTHRTLKQLQTDLLRNQAATISLQSSATLEKDFDG
jgi:hypothetical protein